MSPSRITLLSTSTVWEGQAQSTPLRNIYIKKGQLSTNNLRTSKKKNALETGF